METKDVPYITESTGNHMAQFYNVNRDPALVAEERGLAIVYPKENQLFIDLDNDQSRTLLEKNLDITQKLFPDMIVTYTPSISGGEHFHCVITLGEGVVLEEMQRLLLQACLGSDRTRELLGYARLHLRYNVPITCFFERKD